ncbi:CRISPR system precrRNA processing endoribonuclease RAMP protein Cas6 [Paenibacillus sp. 1P07SE]|uniref:CRISPR system precrRNA processing endoribonuclease RAMP protein Cas6 n=1 Tax=Paenibacillus sp. 1P07SE TaxID=3132209 RepID=UPI0039A77973
MENRSPLFNLDYLPMLIRLRCKETARLPAFLGSTLHGIVGWVLRQRPDAYSYLFENRRLGGARQDIVNPYIIEPPRTKSVYLPGELLTFRLILLGNAARYAEDIAIAFEQVYTIGLGAERKRFEFADILHGTQYQTMWANSRWLKDAVTPENLSSHTCVDQASWCSLHLITPLRIRRGGELVQEINFATILRSITRRIETLAERYGGQLDIAAALQVCESASEVRLVSSALYLNQMHRYSSRKKESVDWSGMLGALTFEGDLSSFTPWLNAARILHIGRNSTFGCGQIDLVYR